MFACCSPSARSVTALSWRQNRTGQAFGTARPPARSHRSRQRPSVTRIISATRGAPVRGCDKAHAASVRASIVKWIMLRALGISPTVSNRVDRPGSARAASGQHRSNTCSRTRTAAASFAQRRHVVPAGIALALALSAGCPLCTARKRRLAQHRHPARPCRRARERSTCRSGHTGHAGHLQRAQHDRHGRVQGHSLPTGRDDAARLRLLRLHPPRVRRAGQAHSADLAAHGSTARAGSASTPASGTWCSFTPAEAGCTTSRSTPATERSGIPEQREERAQGGAKVGLPSPPTTTFHELHNYLTPGQTA